MPPKMEGDSTATVIAFFVLRPLTSKVTMSNVSRSRGVTDYVSLEGSDFSYGFNDPFVVVFKPKVDTE